MQSALDAFDESRFVMTFLIILGVTEILCSFRSVLDGKTFKEILELSRLEFIKRFYQLQNTFIRCKRQHLQVVEQRKYNRFTFFENTISNTPKLREPGFREEMESFLLLAYASLAALRILLQGLLASLNFTLDSENLFFWYKRKN